MDFGVDLMNGRSRRRRQQSAMQEQSFENPAPQQAEYQQPEMMGAFRRIKNKMKNLDPKVKKQIVALMASPLPPITKRLLIARLIKRNKPMNLKKILKGMAIAASFGAGAGVATAIVAKRAIARRKARNAAKAANAPMQHEETPENVTNSVNGVTNTNPDQNTGSISSSQNQPSQNDDNEEEGESGEPPTATEAQTVSTVATDVKKKNMIVIGAVIAGVAGIYLLTKKKK